LSDFFCFSSVLPAFIHWNAELNAVIILKFNQQFLGITAGLSRVFFLVRDHFVEYRTPPLTTETSRRISCAFFRAQPDPLVWMGLAKRRTTAHAVQATNAPASHDMIFAWKA